eukprot:s6374_g6.t1
MSHNDVPAGQPKHCRVRGCCTVVATCENDGVTATGGHRTSHHVCVHNGEQWLFSSRLTALVKQLKVRSFLSRDLHSGCARCVLIKWNELLVGPSRTRRASCDEPSTW